MHWQCRQERLSIGGQPLIMGILNATPDSFSDGGSYLSIDAALARGREMLAEGADIIDIGGESSRPGAEPVDERTEMGRVLPLIEALAAEPGARISIDTAKAAVAREAVRAGACIINDVTALAGDPRMAAVVRETGAGVVLMHMRGTPRTMQDNPQYADVVGEVGDWLASQMIAASMAGIAPDAVALDPGIGFGKSAAHNVALIAGLGRITRLGRPVLAGISRKRFIGVLSGVDVAADRLAGSLAALTAAILHGASILRVHDVAESVQAARVAAALHEASRHEAESQGGVAA
jgi:dihydropteroate synthase